MSKKSIFSGLKSAGKVLLVSLINSLNMILGNKDSFQHYYNTQYRPVKTF